MAKFYGAIGYTETTETAPGVWTPSSFEHNHTGDVIRRSQKWEPGTNANDDLTVSNIFSIVADSFICQNLQNMRYIVWMGAKWKITNAELRRPRVILTVGGVYNG